MTDYDIIEEAIRLVREGVNVTLPVKGRSMLPFIIGGGCLVQKCGTGFALSEGIY